MSRFVDDCRARARFTASLAAGYKASGEILLAQTSERVAAALTVAADAMEDLARLEAGTADRQALAEQTVDRFLANNPGWAAHLMTGGRS